MTTGLPPRDTGQRTEQRDPSVSRTPPPGRARRQTMAPQLIFSRIYDRDGLKFSKPWEQTPVRTIRPSKHVAAGTIDRKRFAGRLHNPGRLVRSLMDAHTSTRQNKSSSSKSVRTKPIYCRTKVSR